ncbi:CopG family ribbon-helix-helix protein [Ferrovibrio sp.]|uniref:CopG family ribbon-helix-helix protein n=1 Tax=Ferrovibrio sp. TaxID=1917215 RepID=UPI003D141441
MVKSNTITARIDPELDAALARIADSQGRSKSAVITEALQSYASYDAWVRAQVQEGLDDLAAGRVHSHEEVTAEMDAIIAAAIAKKRSAA